MRGMEIKEDSIEQASAWLTEAKKAEQVWLAEKNGARVWRLKNLTDKPADDEQFDFISLENLLSPVLQENKQILGLKQYIKDSGAMLSLWPNKGEIREYVHVLFESCRFRYIELQICQESFLAIAYLYEPEVVFLRSKANETVRKRLGRLVRRVENGIDTKRNMTDILTVCDQYGLDGDYLFRFINNTSVNPSRILNAMVNTENI